MIDGGRRFVERFAADGNVVRAAFWTKTEYDSIWFLYIATDLVDSAGPGGAYIAVQESYRRDRNFSILSEEIKVISPSNPVAKDVLAILTKYPNAGPHDTRSGRAILGSMAIEGLYIYSEQVFAEAKRSPMSSEDIGQRIVHLMSRNGDPMSPSRVTLKDATSFVGVPFSLEIGSHRKVQVKFVEEREAVPRVVLLDDISSIA